MHDISIPFEFLAPGLIFAAGGFYFAVRAALKQLSRNVAESNRRTAANHYRSTVILLATCPADRRDQIASWLLQGIIGD
jgi:hypothetical protein